MAAMGSTMPDIDPNKEYDGPSFLGRIFSKMYFTFFRSPGKDELVRICRIYKDADPGGQKFDCKMLAGSSDRHCCRDISSAAIAAMGDDYPRLILYKQPSGTCVEQ